MSVNVLKLYVGGTGNGEIARAPAGRWSNPTLGNYVGTDARLPAHNNGSENALRREAVGRKNWLFVGNDDAGEVNAAFVSLLASCQLHGIEPWTYLRDLFCLIPNWPQRRALELAPASWRQTAACSHTHQLLDANIYRRASMGDGRNPDGTRRRGSMNAYFVVAPCDSRPRVASSDGR